MMRTYSLLMILLCLITVLSCSTESTPTYTLTITASPDEGGTITPNTGSFDEDETVSLQATPAEGWVFSRWEQDLNATANPMNITINRDYNVVGVFEKRMHALTVDVDGEGTVTETVLQQKATDYVHGTIVELEALPAENWVFRHWEGDLSSSDNPAQITVNEPKSIVADFFTFPTVSTGSVRTITEDSAQTGGDVTDDGGASVSERGVCWSTSQNPTTNDSCSSDGSGTGTFSSNLTNLSSFTQYFVRAYATNSAGTAYGSQRNFTTESEWPRDTTTEVVDVTNPVTGKTWMDRNLGASRAATTSTDPVAYGDLYQWGRAADGHEKRSSGTTFKLSSTDTPGHEAFILVSSNPKDWRSPQNDNLWQGINGINNPCPNGYRLPTEAEWQAERQSWSSNDRNGAFSSPLKLPVAGYRSYSSGSLLQVGSYGSYWSGIISVSTTVFVMNFNSNIAYLTNSLTNSLRANGNSVRCIKD